MPRRIPRQEARHLAAQLELLSRYLPSLLEALSTNPAFSRIHLHTLFSPNWGLNSTGNQGIPYALFEAAERLRPWLLRQKKSVKPIHLHLWSTLADARVQRCEAEIRLRNETAAAAQLSFHPLAGSYVTTLAQQTKAPDKRERHIVFVDPAGMTDLQPATLPQLAKRNSFDLLFFLPIGPFFQRFQKRKKPIDAIYADLPAAFMPDLEATTMPENQDQLLSWLRLALRYEDMFSLNLPAEDAEYAFFLISSDAWLSERLMQVRQLLQEQQQPEGQLGLFDRKAVSQIRIAEEEVLALLAAEESLSNADIYKAALHNNLLPAQVQAILTKLVAAEKVILLNEKGKPLAADTPFPAISFTAYKLPKPGGFFKRA